MRYWSALTSVLVLVCASPASALTGHIWSKGVGPGWANGVAADASGNIAVVAQGAGVDFGLGSLDGQGIIAKLSPDGVALWNKSIDAKPYSVAFDAAGNTIVMGAIESIYSAPVPVDLGGGALPGFGPYDAFLLKLDQSGNHVWSRRLGGNAGAIWPADISVDGAGNIFWSGRCSASVDFGAGPVGGDNGFPNYRLFLVKYAPDGTLIWQKVFGTNQPQMQVAVNSAGGFVVAIQLEGTLTLNNRIFQSRGLADILVVRFNPQGEIWWTRQFGGADQESASAVTMDNDSRVAMIGSARTGVDFGGGSVGGAFVTMLDQGGQLLWSRGFDASPYAISVDPAGNLAMTGSCADPADFGGGELRSRTQFRNADVFIARFDAEGHHLSSARFQGTDGADVGRTVTTDGAGNFIFAGSYEGSINFGGQPLPAMSTDPSDVMGIFIAKFGEKPAPPSTHPNIDQFDAVVAGGAVNVTWKITGTADFTLLRKQDSTPPFVTVASGASAQSSYHDASVEPGHNYNYQLVVQGADASRVESPIASVSMPASKDAPQVFRTALGPNAPNPFNPITSIEYAVGERMPVTIDIFDISGRIVTRLQEGVREPGNYRVEWNGRDASGRPVASGIYLYRFSDNTAAGTRKMVLLK